MIHAVLARLAARTRAAGPSGRVALPPAFATREGRWNGRPLALTTEILRDEGGELRLARTSGAEGERGAPTMEALTVILLADPMRAAVPIVFVADVVSFGGAPGIWMIDVTRADGGAIPAGVASALASARATLAPFGDPRVWEGGSPLSDAALAVTLRRDPASGEDGLAAAERAYVEILDASLAATAGPAPASPHDGDALVRTLDRLRASKKQIKALGSLFGDEWVARYFDQVFLAAPAPTARPTLPCPTT